METSVDDVWERWGATPRSGRPPAPASRVALATARQRELSAFGSVHEHNFMPSPSLPFEFTYVRIPANDDEPYEELTGTAKQYGDALSDLLKPAFAGGNK